MCDLNKCGDDNAAHPAPKVSVEDRRLFLKGMLALPLAVVLADPLLALKNGVDPAQARTTLTGWIDWLKQHPDCIGKVGTLGWCFGGG